MPVTYHSLQTDTVHSAVHVHSHGQIQASHYSHCKSLLTQALGGICLGHKHGILLCFLYVLCICLLHEIIAYTKAASLLTSEVQTGACYLIRLHLQKLQACSGMRFCEDMVKQSTALFCTCLYSLSSVGSQGR